MAGAYMAYMPPPGPNRVKQKNTITDGGSSALYAAYTVDTVCIIYTVYTVDMFCTVDMVYTVDMFCNLDIVYTVDMVLHC